MENLSKEEAQVKYNELKLEYDGLSEEEKDSDKAKNIENQLDELEAIIAEDSDEANTEKSVTHDSAEATTAKNPAGTPSPVEASATVVDEKPAVKVVAPGDVSKVVAEAHANNSKSFSHAPGTGIDTDGDGNADYVVGAPTDEDLGETFDTTGKVKLSHHDLDYIDKDKAITLVKESHVREVYKDELLKQIEADKLTPPYANMLRKIEDADTQGSKYSGTLEG